MTKIDVLTAVVALTLILCPNPASPQTTSSDKQPAAEKGIIDQGLDQMDKAGRAIEEGRDEFYAHPLDSIAKAGEWLIDNAPEAWDWTMQKTKEFEQAKSDFWNGRWLPWPPPPGPQPNGNNPTGSSSHATIGEPINAGDAQLPPDSSASSFGGGKTNGGGATGTFTAFDAIKSGGAKMLNGGEAPIPTAALDATPQSRNMGSVTADKPPEADGYKFGPECDH